MAQYDLLIRNAGIVTHDDVQSGDIAITGGVFVAVGGDLSGSAAEEIDASGLVAMAGAVDTHVHFNEPGRVDWEGVASGSNALAAGGATTFVDMPLNSDPPLLTRRDFDAKLTAAEGASRVDFGFWGGLVAGGQGTMPELAAAGVLGFKCFMCDSGIPEFPHVDDETLHDATKIAADLGLPILVHAESDEIVGRLTRAAREAGRVHTMEDFVATHPVEAEVEAIERVVALAEGSGCALHIVHVSSERGAQAVLDAQARGVDVSLETCPQYLVLDVEDLERAGALAKAGPPPRGGADRLALWEKVSDERIPMVVSDHSPSSPDLKVGPLLDCWGGIAGCQSTLQLMLEYGHHLQGVPLERIGRLVASNPADRFGLTGKGRIAAGADADLSLVDLTHAAPLTADDLHYRHRVSAYLGMTHRGRVHRTIVRGSTVFRDGQPVGAPSGRLIRRPASTE